MRRREFILLLGGASAWPIAARAQQAERVRRTGVPVIGLLLLGGGVTLRDHGLIHELARLGYVEGRNIAYLLRNADGAVDRLPGLARELLAMNPDVLVGSGSPVAHTLGAATSKTPIVMMVMGDPIALGLSKSISRPSGNVTGFTNSSLSLAAKRLELLRDLIPGLRKVGYLWAPESPIVPMRTETVRVAATTLGIDLVSLPLTSALDVPTAIARAEEEHVGAILVESDALVVRFSSTIIDECLVRDLPAMHAWPFEVLTGALLAYGAGITENYPVAASYVDRLLRGAKIDDLPIQEPTHIKLAINLRTARSIGITIPPSLLARADEVIE